MAPCYSIYIACQISLLILPRGNMYGDVVMANNFWTQRDDIGLSTKSTIHISITWNIMIKDPMPVKKSMNGLV